MNPGIDPNVGDNFSAFNDMEVYMADTNNMNLDHYQMLQSETAQSVGNSQPQV